MMDRLNHRLGQPLANLFDGTPGFQALEDLTSLRAQQARWKRRETGDG
jgi:hypothetical protein